MIEREKLKRQIFELDSIFKANALVLESTTMNTADRALLVARPRAPLDHPGDVANLIERHRTTRRKACCCHLGAISLPK